MGVKKLFVDMDKLGEHNKACARKCSYYYHPGNDGMISLEEVITYTLICRKCERENCITSCPFSALEKGPDKVLRRYNMRCTSCKTCSHACHSGVILPHFIPYMTYNCDLCMGRLGEGEVPECVEACGCGAIKYGYFKADDADNMFEVGKNIIAHSTHWQRETAKKR